MGRNGLIKFLLDFGSDVGGWFVDRIFKLCSTSYDLDLYVFTDDGSAVCGERLDVGWVGAPTGGVCAQNRLDKAAKRVANFVYFSGELHVVEARPVEMYTRPEGLGWLQNGEWGRVVIG